MMLSATKWSRVALLLIAVLGICAPAQAQRLRFTHAQIPGLLSFLPYNFGALTPTGQGSVRLSSPGLGLLLKGVPISWRIADPTNSGDWKYNGTTLNSTGFLAPEGAAAMTPTLTAAGVAAAQSGALAANYSFAVTAQFTDLSSSVATLQVTMISGAVSLGNDASLALPTSPAFGGTAGEKILLSSGANRTAISLSNLNFANPVTLTQANPAMPGAFTNVSVKGSSNITIDGMYPTPGYGGNLFTFASLTAAASTNSHDITLQNSGAIFPKPMSMAPDNISVVGLLGCDNCTVTNIQAQNLGALVTESQNTIDTGFVLTNSVIRGNYNNGVFIANLRPSSRRSPLIQDVAVIAPFRDTASHIDTLQIANGSAVTGLTASRIQSWQAEGDAFEQGAPFGSAPVCYSVFIDDGSGGASPATSGHPGNVLKFAAVPSGCGYSALYYGGTPLVAASGLVNGTRVIALKTGSNAVSSTFYVDTPQQTPGVITVYVGNNQATWDGELYTGRTINSFLLPSTNNFVFRDYTDMRVVSPDNINTTTFMGGVSGTTLTIDTGTLTSTWIPAGTGVDINAHISGGGLPYPTLVTAQLTGLTRGVGTYRLSNSANVADGTPFAVSDDSGFPGSGPVIYLDSGLPTFMFTGSGLLAGGFMYGGINGSLPSNWTTDGHVFPTGGAGDHYNTEANLQNYFAIGSYPAALNAPGLDGNVPLSAATWASMVTAAGGDPEYFLEHIPATTWADMTIAQVKAANVAALLPKAGGPLDAGSGNAYGALTFSGAWNDGSGITP